MGLGFGHWNPYRNATASFLEGVLKEEASPSFSFAPLAADIRLAVILDHKVTFTNCLKQLHRRATRSVTTYLQISLMREKQAPILSHGYFRFPITHRQLNLILTNFLTYFW